MQWELDSNRLQATCLRLVRSTERPSLVNGEIRKSAHIAVQRRRQQTFAEGGRAKGELVYLWQWMQPTTAESTIRLYLPKNRHVENHLTLHPIPFKSPTFREPLSQLCRRFVGVFAHARVPRCTFAKMQKRTRREVSTEIAFKKNRHLPFV